MWPPNYTAAAAAVIHRLNMGGTGFDSAGCRTTRLKKKRAKKKIDQFLVGPAQPSIMLTNAIH
jgi:hypothetical protein